MQGLMQRALDLRHGPSMHKVQSVPITFVDDFGGHVNESTYKFLDGACGGAHANERTRPSCDVFFLNVYIYMKLRKPF